MTLANLLHRRRRAQPLLNQRRPAQRLQAHAAIFGIVGEDCALEILHNAPLTIGGRRCEFLGDWVAEQVQPIAALPIICERLAQRVAGLREKARALVWCDGGEWLAGGGCAAKRRELNKEWCVGLIGVDFQNRALEKLARDRADVLGGGERCAETIAA